MKSISVSKFLKTLLKISISVILFYFVFTKIDINQILNVFKKSNWFYIILTLLFFITSQIVAAFRLNYIFSKNHFYLNQVSNIKLYFVGMLYNTLIPGGIGGDAYKIYLLNKKLQWNTKETTKCVLIDRLIGLISIVFIMTVLSTYIFFSNFIGWVTCLCILTIIFFISKIIFIKFLKNTNLFYNKSFLYSLFAQALQVIALLCIVAGFNLDMNMSLEFSLVFLLSSILTVISFAGFGSREYVFLKAANFLTTTTTLATSIALLINVTGLIISLIGVFFLFQKLELKTLEEKLNL